MFLDCVFPRGSEGVDIIFSNLLTAAEPYLYSTGSTVICQILRVVIRLGGGAATAAHLVHSILIIITCLISDTLYRRFHTTPD